MNVNDVAPQTATGEPLRAIFARQRELMDKYHEIEARNGTGYAFVKDIPVDLHDRKAQALLKDFAWRATEEITEATLAVDDDAHRAEEVLDALHFIVELATLSGVGPEDIEATLGMDFSLRFAEVAKFSGRLDHQNCFDYRHCAYDVVEGIGEAMNMLKNKPWKTTQMLTDEPRYRATIARVFDDYVSLAISVGIKSIEQLVDLYLRKSEVNRFRIRSKY